MVHSRKKSKKELTFDDVLDEMVEKLGWKVVEKKKDEKDYLKGRLKVKYSKTKAGYKIILFKNNKLYDSDITNSKKMATTLLGETLMFRDW